MLARHASRIFSASSASRRRRVAAASLTGLVTLLTGALIVTVGPSPAMAAPASSDAASVFTTHGLDHSVLTGVTPKVTPQGKGSELATALAEAKRAGKRVEVVGQRGIASTTYANPDGTVTRVLTGAPIRARGGDGSLKPIDTTLTTAHGRLAPKATNAKVSLRATAAPGARPVTAPPTLSPSTTRTPTGSATAAPARTNPPAKATTPAPTSSTAPSGPTSNPSAKPASAIRHDSATGWTAVTASFVHPLAATDTGTGTTPDVANLDVAGPGDITLGFGDALPAPTVSGDTATYALSATADLTATTLDNGFAADVVLDAAPGAAPTYKFPLTLAGGLTPKLADGVLKFVDGDGKTVALSRPLQMWDAHRGEAGDPDHVTKVTAALVQNAGGWELDLTPSMSWLSSTDRQYPVTVDPTVVTKDDADTWYSNGGTTDNGADYKLLVGTDDSGATVRRTYMRWNTGPFTGRVVTGATLSLFQYEAGSCSAKTMKIYPTTTYSALDSANVKTNKDTAWDQSPSFNTGGAGCTSSNAYVNADVTKIVSAWVTGEVPQYGLETQAASETDNTYAKRFCSRNAAPAGTGHCEGTTGVPSLSVSYVYGLGVKPHGGTTIDHGLNGRSQLSVNTQDGDGLYKATDLHLGGRGLDLTVDRFYNSEAANRDSQFGPNWAMSLGADVYLSRGSNSNRWDYVAPGGTWYGRFVRQTTTGNTNQFWEPSFGAVDADLQDNGDNTFTMTFHQSQEKYVFDNLGCATCDMVLKKDIDRNGNGITYGYDTTSRQLTAITDTHGRVLNVHHAANGYIDSISEPTGSYAATPRTWTYHYNASNQLDYFTDATGARTDYGYTNNLLSSITDPAQADGKRPKTTIGYSNAQVTSIAYSNDSIGGVKQFNYSYSTDSAAAQTACSAGETWGYFTSVQNVSDPQGGTTKYCFKDRANPPSPTNPNGASSDAEKIRVIDGMGHYSSDTFIPDLATQVSTSQSNEGVAGGSAVFTYGTNNTLKQTTEPKDSSSSAAGNSYVDYATSGSVAGGSFLPSSASAAGGSCSALTYDARGNVTDTYTGLAATSTAGTDPSCSGKTGGQHTHVDYNTDGTIKDAYSAAVASSSPTSSDETLYSYFTAEPNSGELKQLVRPGGNATCTTDRSGCTTYTYDGYSRVDSTTDGNGNTTRYSYDAADRVTQVLTAGATTCTPTAGTCIQYSYDGEGNLTKRIDKNGTTTFSYDWRNNPATQTQPDSTVLTTAYDGAGNLTKYVQTLPSVPADTVSYSYDAANELTTVADATGSYGYNYDNEGRPTTLTLPGTAGSIAYTYTGTGNLKTITPSNSGLPAWTYSYTDGSGQDIGKLQKTTNRDGSTVIYGYDGSERLQTATASAGTSYSYTYDPDNNIRKAVAGATTTYFGYNENDGLCWSGNNDDSTKAMGATCPTAPTGDTAYTSDKAGNNLGPAAGPLHYNPQNQLDQISSPTGAGPVNQGYSDQSNSLRLTYGSATFTDGSPLGVTAGRDTGGATYYTRDPNGQLLNEHGASGTYHYLLDRQGSIMALIDSAGSKAGSYSYDPYGKTSVASGTSTTAAQTNPWRYTGGYQNPTDGYYYLRARYYDAAGHFTQQDPLPGDITRSEKYNCYNYASGDPITNIDPTGLQNFTLYVSRSMVRRIFAHLGDYRAWEYICGATAGLLGRGWGKAVAIFCLDFGWQGLVTHAYWTHKRIKMVFHSCGYDYCNYYTYAVVR